MITSEPTKRILKILWNWIIQLQRHIGIEPKSSLIWDACSNHADDLDNILFSTYFQSSKKRPIDKVLLLLSDFFCKCFSFAVFRYTALWLSIPLNTRINTDSSTAFIVIIYLQLMDVRSHHLSCVGDAIKVLINAEKYEFAIELSDHSVAWTSTKNPFLLKHPTDLYLLAVQNSWLGFCHENYIKFVTEFDRKEDIPH